MNVTPLDRQIQVINALVEGNSIRATSRLVGAEHKTVMRVLVRVGDACGQLLNEWVRNVTAKRIEVDEIWTYVFKKQAHLDTLDDHHELKGDQYVFVAIESESKLAISHLIGKRDAATAFNLMADLQSRLANRVQLTTDGFMPYVGAVEESFGIDIDYAMLVKMYGGERSESAGPAWYGPAHAIDARPVSIMGDPDEELISTSFIERQNLTMRMQMRRFTRLTNGFSKKLPNLRAAVAIHFAHYNFVRVHSSLRVTPAMEAGLTDHVWELAELLTANARRQAA